MDSYIANSFDTNYAAAWSADQGSFSSQLADNLIAWLKKNNVNAKSCLDLAFGTGEFLYHFKKENFLCAGTEIAQSMVAYTKAQYPDMNLTLTSSLTEIPIKEKFDVITCNHDMVNTLERLVDWQNLFKAVEHSLNRNGVFMFDYYTKKKLENWNEVMFEESEDMDHVTHIKKGMDNKCIFNEIYYIHDEENKYSKTFDIQVEAYFDNQTIVDTLKKAGFKNVQLCNYALEPLENPEARNRIHVIARR